MITFVKKIGGDYYVHKRVRLRRKGGTKKGARVEQDWFFVKASRGANEM